jgi:small subunit ribosomal protein S1
MVIEDIELGEDINFEQMLNESFEKETSGSVVDGVVVGVKDDALLIDVGQKIEARLNINEVTVDGELQFKEGDSIPVMIVGSKGERPFVSHQKVIQQKKFQELIDSGSIVEDAIVEGKVTALKRRAGFTILGNDGLEYFMPMTQAYLKAEGAVGKKVKAKILKINKDQNSIVVSRKKLIEDIKAIKEEKVQGMLDADKPVAAKVTKITSYGLFADIGDGIEGLINYNEISYKGPVNPSEHYQEGDEVAVKVLSYDKEKGHISLSIKEVLPNPWIEIQDELEVGDTITVTVSNFESYGAFVDLGNDIEGLLHVSELSWEKNIQKPQDVLTQNEEINVEVIELNIEKQRLRVSLKNLQEKPFDKFKQTHKVGDTVTGKVATLTDFGAFVSVEGVDGLLHNDECSWTSTEKCKELFKKGDEVTVKIIKIDPEKQNISFSLKEASDSPAREFQDRHSFGDIIKGTIKDIKDFGVFVTLTENLDGLIRYEDLAPLKREEIEKGEEIEAVITNIDTRRNKVRLSVRRLERERERKALESINNENDEMTLGDLIRDKF